MFLMMYSTPLTVEDWPAVEWYEDGMSVTDTVRLLANVYYSDWDV